MAVHISALFAGLECTDNRDFCSKLGVIVRIAMLTCKEKFKSL